MGYFVPKSKLPEKEPKYYSYSDLYDMIIDDMPDNSDIICPVNRFRKGTITLVLYKFRSYQIWRIIKIMRAEKKLRGMIRNKDIEITWETCSD